MKHNFGLIWGTNVKSVSQFNTYHKLFGDDFILQMGGNCKRTSKREKGKKRKSNCEKKKLKRRNCEKKN